MGKIKTKWGEGFLWLRGHERTVVIICNHHTTLSKNFSELSAFYMSLLTCRSIIMHPSLVHPLSLFIEKDVFTHLGMILCPVCIECFWSVVFFASYCGSQVDYFIVTTRERRRGSHNFNPVVNWLWIEKVISVQKSDKRIFMCYDTDSWNECILYK